MNEYPWSDLYDDAFQDLSKSNNLSKIKSIKDIMKIEELDGMKLMHSGLELKDIKTLEQMRMNDGVTLKLVSNSDEDRMKQKDVRMMKRM